MINIALSVVRPRHRILSVEADARTVLVAGSSATASFGPPDTKASSGS